MAQSQITYNDKVENGGISDDGKVRSADLNELKTVVNDNATDVTANSFTEYFDGFKNNGLSKSFSSGDIDTIDYNSFFSCQTNIATGVQPPFTGTGVFYFLQTIAYTNTTFATQIAWNMDHSPTGQFCMRVKNAGVWRDWVVYSSDENFVPIDSTEIKIGSNAGNTNQGANSVAVGNLAGQVNLGANSVAIGTNAGQNSAGSEGTFIGRLAGQNATGLNVTCIGNSAGTNLTTETNATCLGTGAQVTGSSQVQLGNSSTTTYAYGAVQDRSDERDKADIEDIHLGLDFIDALTPRSYKFDYREDYREHQEDAEGNIIPDTRELGEITHDGTHKRSRLHCGLVAQEVKQVMDDLGVDFGGYQDHSINGGQDVLSIGYGELIAPLIKAVQELKARVEVLESK